MMSVIESLRQAWLASPELSAIVPAGRVHLGPPNPGAAAPCVGLVSERVAIAGRSSTARYVGVAATVVAQAESPDVLEAIRDAAADGLDEFASERYGALRMTECTMEIDRAAGPSRLWHATLSLAWECLRA